jgi:hypothetical protein
VQFRLRVYPGRRISPAQPTEAQVPSAETLDKTTVNSTLTFHEERPETIVEADFKVIDMRLLKPLESKITTDIKEIMGRPQQIAKFDWTTSQTANQKIFSLNVPYDVLAASGSHPKNIWLNRLLGYGNIRAKAVIRIQINAQRFQAGRLICTTFPQPEFNPQRYAQTNMSLVFRSQLPRVELDCSVNSTGIIEFPYVSPHIGYNITNGSSNNGIFDIVIYSPLVDPSGTGTVGVTVWMHFEDVEIFFPVQSQSAKFSRGRGGSKVDEVHDAELSSLGHPSISSMLASVSNVAQRAQQVPLLSSVAAPAAWATGLAAKAASAFGFCNPSISDGASQMVVRPSAAAHNVNGVDMSQKLGLFQDNSVQVLPGAYGTDVDEMSFAHIASRFSYFKHLAWSSSNSAGTVILNQPIQMSSFADSLTQNSVTMALPSPLMYVSQFFRYFRGTIRLCFKFVKTEFHSGRLMFAYSPTIGATGEDIDFVFREVVDLREMNEYSMVIPYVSDKQYLDNLETYPSFSPILGYVSVTVINELVAPSTVGSSVDVLVEVAGDLDNEFAVPNPICRLPVMAQPGSGVTTDPSTFPPVLPTPVNFAPEVEYSMVKNSVRSQVAGDNTCVEEGKRVPLPSNNVPFSGMTSADASLVPSVYCIGEKVTSVRQLIKRHSIWRWSPTGSVNKYAVIPDIPYCYYVPATGTITKLSDAFVDYISYWAPLFMYFRGGIRVRYYSGDNSSSGLITAMYVPGTYLTDTNNPSTITFDTANLVSKAYSLQRINGGIEVECPQWSRNHMKVVNQFSSLSGTPPRSDVFTDYTLIVATQDQDTTNYFTRAGSDDYELGYFLTTMPLVSSGTYGAAQTDVFV